MPRRKLMMRGDEVRSLLKSGRLPDDTDWPTILSQNKVHENRLGDGSSLANQMWMRFLECCVTSGGCLFVEVDFDDEGHYLRIVGEPLPKTEKPPTPDAIAAPFQVESPRSAAKTPEHGKRFRWKPVWARMEDESEGNEYLAETKILEYRNEGKSMSALAGWYEKNLAKQEAEKQGVPLPKSATDIIRRKLSEIAKSIKSPPGFFSRPTR